MPSDNEQAEKILEALKVLEEKTDALADKSLTERVEKIEKYINELDKMLVKIGDILKQFEKFYRQFLNLVNAIIKPLSFLFEFVTKFTGD